MGNSVIWWLPEGADRLARIDFGRSIGDIAGPYQVYTQTITESASGVQATRVVFGRSEIQLGHIWNRGSRDASGDGDLLRRKLVSLVGHLQRGGTCIFTRDEDYAWAGFLAGIPSSEQSSVIIDQNLFSELVPSPDPLDGREIWVNSDHDRYLFQHLRCSTQSGAQVNLAQNLAIDFADSRWVLVRDYFTYPALRMPARYRESGEFVPHEHEFTFTLALPLEEDPAQLDVLHALNGVFPGESPGPAGGGGGLQANGTVGAYQGPVGSAYNWVP